MSKKIRNYVQTYMVCQMMKSRTSKPQGLLMPLPTPNKVWQDISTDFITYLPCIKSKYIIVVVVDRLTKLCHLGALSIGDTSKMVSIFFVENIIKLHEIPSKSFLTGTRYSQAVSGKKFIG